MKGDRIQTYLRALERKLWLRASSNPETMAELESHLLESVEAGLHQGLGVDEAEEQALERFGSVKVIAHTFEKERKNLMQNVLLALGALAGLFFAYVDSRPTWDDTGILAGAILLTCGLIALIGYRRPWLLALMVGAWIPLRGIFITQNYFSLIALIIAFIGAYGGWVVRLGIRKTFHLA
jgi:hypothetical protein